MKCAILFSGGKDSTLAAYIARKSGYTISCLVSIISKNPYSYMFHTPSISRIKKQAEVMRIPLIIRETEGEKELELIDLEKAICEAKEKYHIECIVTGAIESVYQFSRIKNICDKLALECYAPLWKKNQFEILEELIKNNFDVIITGVAAYPLTKEWLGRKIDNCFLEEIKKLHIKYGINPAGEGGEYETFVLNCPLFSKKLEIKDRKIVGEKNNWRMEIDLI